MAKGGREKIKLESTAGTGHFYTTTKNKKTTPGKLEFLKYDPKARRSWEMGASINAAQKLPNPSKARCRRATRPTRPPIKSRPATRPNEGSAFGEGAPLTVKVKFARVSNTGSGTRVS